MLDGGVPTIRRLLERVLKAQIRNALRTGEEYRIILHISARSAILSFFQGLSHNGGAPMVLVQDHICASVPRAIELAGANVRCYPLGKTLVPEEKELESLIRRDSPDVVLFSPIFGAQGEAYDGQVNKWSEAEEAPIIILDQAQYMGPLACRPEAVVLSFHNKSIDSMNGGALLLHHSFLGCEPPQGRDIGMNEEFYLALLLRSFRKRGGRRARVDKTVQPGFAFDDSRYLPSKLENAKMPLVSMIVIIAQMTRLEHYSNVRRSNFKELRQRIEKIPGAHIVFTENADTASRFPIWFDDERALAQVAGSLAELGVRVGRPYCRYDDPLSSARPELYSVSNPFYDIRS